MLELNMLRLTIILFEKKVARGQLLTQFVRSKEQLANIHTKASKKQVFAEFRSKLRGNVEDRGS